ncbi:transporter substrate-binding domain-containing protein [Roseovarius pelagicus]|uniref:Transporter substrate-binding domain-containing protein n=1 Tax=Roseovarius pelagicus TaxID=2980108 RepID=A0ABY6DCI1_9RHOB|nr:transporter substrate-binding domain-containing protein [Roseovarius pelagicus]UXX83813.1 transporter substrate-binding domain-containing protein [Roseovarius pelagicus]
MKYGRRTALIGAMVGLVGIATTLGGAPAQAQDATANSLLNEIQSRGVLRVGTTGDYYPMTFREVGKDEFVGHQIDAAREMAKDLGVEVEFVTTEWKTMITGIQAGRYDIAMSGTSMSLSRAKVVGMSTPWGINGFVPVVLRKNADQYASWDDLNSPDRTVGVTLGTTMEDYIRAELPNAEMRRVESPGNGWQEVLAGRSDYTVTTLVEASGLQERYEEIQMIFPEQARSALPMAFLTPIEDQIWLNYVNNWVLLKKQAGYFDALNETWGVVLLGD